MFSQVFVCSRLCVSQHAPWQGFVDNNVDKGCGQGEFTPPLTATTNPTVMHAYFMDKFSSL